MMNIYRWAAAIAISTSWTWVSPAQGAISTLTFGNDSTFICQGTKLDNPSAYVGCVNPNTGRINDSHLNQQYGDIPGEVNLTYRNGVGSTLLLWDTGYANLTDVVWSQGGRDPATDTDGDHIGDNNSFAQITLTAQPGYSVTLLGFDLGAYLCCDKQLASRDTYLRVYELGNAVADPFNPSYVQPISTSLADHFSYSTASSKGWVIEWENSAFNVGLDNLQFSVSSVPEPETYVMLLSGLALLGWGATRRKSAYVGSGKLPSALPDAALIYGVPL
ncbi:MAG: PEP-CTERM sorting domain-containing protein [Burkholderiales bacterium]